MKHTRTSQQELPEAFTLDGERARSGHIDQTPKQAPAKPQEAGTPIPQTTRERVYLMAPAPCYRITPGEPVITTKCSKCGNTIKLAVKGLTREQVETAIAKLDHSPGECPGGYHVELSGWRRLWNLDEAVEAYFNPPTREEAGPMFNPPTREELTFDGEASFSEDRQ